ncbi:adenylate/guanylate cyclase domain-containing protein [Rhodococcus sp. HNM0569]|uniref:adenylate/guanylate cyclase domain-containing protein n=1 Tax=Rhodococcus sp. HNM0569 TaxID=2716340 RepID=UPI00146BCF68|nr:adenylate/guanylate cyclase domain-containing protein [Rhodococcus sp. HNM0569]NLU81606.1 adenylate/guanylate cyclase domain-containing protein [Rhodococcus sp. HNM0569]
MQLPQRSAAPMGSWLLGSPDENTRIQRIRVQALLTVPLVVTNLVGAGVAIALVSVVLPGPSTLTREFALVNFVAVPVCVVLAVLVGITWGTRRLTRDLRWATRDLVPNEADRRAAFAAPGRLTRLQASLWAACFVIITALYGLIDLDVVPKIAFTIALTGVTVSAFCNLLAQFALRPVAARALEAGGIPRGRSLGVTGRTVVAWLLGTGVPVVGLMLIAIFTFIRPAEPANLAVAILALGGVILLVGLLLVVVSVRATTAPLRSVQRAMQQVERGDLDTAVVVYDATELGVLQNGFNRMAEGLRERERIRDLFGRHVGHEVARNAVERNPELGGEERDVAVLFVDIVGSTRLAAQNSPAAVVDLLNRFFLVVVDEIDRRRGFVNKFEGDGALAVFGAPNTMPDPAGSALAAGRAIRDRLARDVPECTAGIGIAAGRAVAGNVGAHQRFEYTVIGDPVNEAARLCEQAKSVPGHLVASSRAVDAADGDERALWHTAKTVTLRGRLEPTDLAVPLEGAAHNEV